VWSLFFFASFLRYHHLLFLSVILYNWDVNNPNLPLYDHLYFLKLKWVQIHRIQIYCILVFRSNMIYLLRIFEIGLLFLHIFRICFVIDYLYLFFWFFDMNIYLHISYILLISLSYRIIPYLVVFCCIFLGFFLWILCIFVLLLFELFQMFFLQIFIFFKNLFVG
jgi:hypothetical protein